MLVSEDFFYNSLLIPAAPPQLRALSSDARFSPGSRAGPGRGLTEIHRCFLTSVNKEPLNYTNTKLLRAVLHQWDLFESL